MKITIRVYQETNEFQVDAEPSDTIGDLKAKIHESQGYPIEGQTILFCARVPTDDMTLEASRISDRGFIALLMTKERPPMPEPRPVSPSEFQRPPQDQSASGDASSDPVSAPILGHLPDLFTPGTDTFPHALSAFESGEWF